MIRFIVYLSVFIVSTFLSVVTAQNKAKIPCSSQEYSQFNFWVGNWDVYDTQNKLIGHNKVVQVPNACAIQENWTSKTSKSKGTSYNYYNKVDNSWNQVWVDNSGFSLTLKGTYNDNRMTLKSSIIKSNKGDYYNQIIWTKNNDGSVMQVWNYIDERQTIIKEVFKGIYKKHQN